MQRSSLLAAACAALLVLSACRDEALVSPTDPAATAPRADVRTGWVFGPDGTPTEIRFSVLGGRAIYEGDMDFGPADAVPSTREALLSTRQPGGPSYGVAINGYRWGSVVPYVISSSFSASQRQTILDGMAHIAANSPGVSFRQRVSESAYISFQLSTVCNSPVGRRGGAQTINLAAGCAGVMGIVAHEVLHSLGVWHEQSRCDRDSYVIVNLSNVQSGQEHNFDKKCSGNSTVFAYDEGSVMHYDPYAFSRNGLPTITSRRGLDYLMGQRSGLGSQDIRTVAWMYPSAPVIYPIDWQNYEPILFWRNTRAGSYDVYLVTEEWWRHAYDGSGSSSWRYIVGTTSDTTFTDWSNPNTGQYSCDTSRDMYEERYESYYYEVVAVFGYNVTRSHRTGAAVGRC